MRPVNGLVAEPSSSLAAATACVAVVRPAEFQRGFTYVGLLIAIAVLGIGLAAIGSVWHTASQREREAELLFVGEQFQRAIRSYFERSPEAGKTYPKALGDLLEDRRSGSIVRHLRKVYVDPMMGTKEWGLVKQPDGRIIGVHSLAATPVFRTSDLPEGIQVKGNTHRDWLFMGNTSANAPAPAAASAGAPGTAAPGSPAGDMAPRNPVMPGAEVPPEEPPPNPCAEQRRTEMLKCSELQDAARTKCENDSARSYATCVRNAARKG